MFYNIFQFIVLNMYFIKIENFFFFIKNFIIIFSFKTNIEVGIMKIIIFIFFTFFPLKFN